MAEDMTSAHPGPLARRGIELPEVVDDAKFAGCVIAGATEQPEIPVPVGPADRGISCPGRVPGVGYMKIAIRAVLIPNLASGHPCPLVRSGTEFPNIVEVPLGTHRIDAVAAEKPQIPAWIRPGDGQLTAAGHVARGKLAQRAVNAGDLLTAPVGAGAAHPGPLFCGGIEHPEIICQIALSVGCVGLAPKQPEVTVLAGPMHGDLPRSRYVRGGRNAQGSITSGRLEVSAAGRNSGLGAAAALPRPFPLRQRSFIGQVEHVR